MRTLEARVLLDLVLDRPLDLDRDPPLHRQREQLAVVGGEGRRRPRRARALDADAVVPRLRQLAQEAHRLRRERSRPSPPDRPR